MVEPLLPATVRLTSATEALAALAAHVRVETEGLEVDPRIRTLLAAIATEVIGSSVIGPSDPAAQAVGMARAFLRESTALVEHPERTGGWSTVDDVVLQGVGRLSMSIAPLFRLAADSLPGLADALAAPSGTFMDVGTGTGWLAIATAREFPSARIVGIDVFEPALALARRNVADEGLSQRVTLRHVDVTALSDTDAYDAVWLPLPFLPQAIVPTAIDRARDALRPGGWLLPGTFAGLEDTVSRLLTDLRIVRSGGHPWPSDELVALLSAAGLAHPHEVPRTWPAPLRLFAAQRPA